MNYDIEITVQMDCVGGQWVAYMTADDERNQSQVFASFTGDLDTVLAQVKAFAEEQRAKAVGCE